MGRIVVFGSLNMDLTIGVPTLPHRGQTVTGDRLQMFAGGKGANQAVAAAKLGGEVIMIGRVGKDAMGDRMVQELNTAGVDTEHVSQDPGNPTGAALVMVEASGQNLICVAPGANAHVGQADVAAAARLLDAESIFVLQGEVPLNALKLALRVGAGRRAKVIFNASPSAGLSADLIDGVDLLVVNEHEASDLFGTRVSGMGSARRTALRATQAGAKAAIITLGPAGAALGDGHNTIEVPAYPVKATDTTGAGDAFVGALAVALSLGWDLERAARAGSAAGAAATLKTGAQASLPTRDDLKRLFSIEM